MHLQRSIYEKFQNGDPLSNYEIDQGAEFHKELANTLSKLGPVFYTAFKESNRVAMAFIEFQNARNVKRAKDDTETVAYKEGYQTGLTWDADWTPGGPYVFTCDKWAPAEKQIVAKESAEAHRLWVWGWKVGFAVDPNKPIMKSLRNGQRLLREMRANSDVVSAGAHLRGGV